MAIDGKVEQVAQVTSNLTIENQGNDSVNNLSQITSDLNQVSQIVNEVANESQVVSETNNESQVESSINNKGHITSKVDKPTTIAYEGGETQDIVIKVDNSTKKIMAQIKPIQYTSIGEFPNVGSDNLIYIDTSSNTPYRFDSSTLTYIRLGSDWNDIEIIDGGNA